MTEKKGFTGKLKYDFPTQKCLEVKLSNGKWYRVTANDFRSFDTERRIGVGDDVTPYNEENTGKIAFHPLHPRPEVLLRPHERHLLDKV